MDPSNSLLLVTKKCKSRKRRTLSTPLDARKKAKKNEKRKEYYVKPPCSVNCRRKCISHIDENRRIQINDEFWQMSWDEQRQFILNNTQRLNVKRQTNRVDVSARKNSYTYHMKNENGTIFQVCKPFFLTTLGFKPSNDKVVQNTLNMSVNQLTFTRDMRGKKPSTKKLDRTKIRLHIESFHPSISHYRREHAPNRWYLPSHLTLTYMCKEFNKDNPNFECSYDVYRNVLKDLNISFAKLGHGECEICGSFDHHEHTKDNLQADCTTCNSYSCHKDRANKSRDQYRKDANMLNRDISDVCYCPIYPENRLIQ
ncbi:uncharacterized protein [Leptinotarsa decemlineata]|uniref:uncharacterized protein n=1 Tax=Leptinotarsa decemlineata TaxID=7539 RepID=UPI003D307D65